MRAALLQQRGFIAKGFIVSCHEALMPCSANTMHAASYSVLSQVSSAVLIDDCFRASVCGTPGKHLVGWCGGTGAAPSCAEGVQSAEENHSALEVLKGYQHLVRPKESFYMKFKVEPSYPGI